MLASPTQRDGVMPKGVYRPKHPISQRIVAERIRKVEQTKTKAKK